MAGKIVQTKLGQGQTQNSDQPLGDDFDFTFLTRLCLYFKNIEDTSKEELDYLAKKSLIELNKQLSLSSGEERHYLENVWFRRPAGIVPNLVRIGSISETENIFSNKIKQLEIELPKEQTN